MSGGLDALDVDHQCRRAAPRDAAAPLKPMPAPDSARAAAALLLCNLEQQTSSLDELLQVLDAKLPINRDARFARQLALGAVRWQKRLDWMLGTINIDLAAPLENVYDGNSVETWQPNRSGLITILRALFIDFLEHLSSEKL